MSMFPDESQPRAPAGEPPDGTLPAAPSPFSRLPLLAGLVFAVVAEAFLVLALSGEARLSVVVLGIPLISGLFALGCCLLASVALQGRERGAWTLLGLACLGGLVAQGTRFVPLSISANLAAAPAGGYPSLASGALIAQSVGFFLAFLLFPPPARRAALLVRLGQFFDGALVVGAATVSIIYFVLLPFAQVTNGALTAAQMTTLAICVGDLLLLGGMTFALRSMGARRSPLSGALGMLGLAMLLLVGADVASMVLTPNHLAPADSPLQAIWNASYLAMGLGALLRLRSGGHRAAEAEAGSDEEGAGVWLALPFALTAAVAGSIVVDAMTRAASATQMLVALACASLLVALIGLRHLVGLFAIRRMAAQRRALERDVALAGEQVEQLRSSQLFQARARQESLNYLLDTLTRFGYGDAQARVGALERELAPLAEPVNALLERAARQSDEHGREPRLIPVLADALGRLAQGELHDLPELPAPDGSALDGLMTGVVQVRTRLMSLQATIQQYEQERSQTQQQLEQARQELAQGTQTQRQAALATEEQRKRLQAQAQAAEARVAEVEKLLRAAEERLTKERWEAEQRLKAERQALEARLQEVARSDSALLVQVRQRGEHLALRFNHQAERLHAAAATIQTAAEVAQRLARTIEETAALLEKQSAASESVEAQPPAAPLPALPPADSRQLNALQMLERLAGLRPASPGMPVPAPAPAPKPSAGAADGSAHERVAQRLRMAASRAEEIATGLLELAMQCIQAGDESARAAEEAGNLANDLEIPTLPDVAQRPMLPARAPKSRRS